MSFLQNWDFILIGLLSILFIYNFILGKNSNIKLIISIYISTFIADGTISFISIFFKNNILNLESFLSIYEKPIFMIIRIGLFLGVNILFLSRESFSFNIKKHNHIGIRMFLHFCFSLFASFLFLSTILLYFKGYSFFNGFDILITKEVFKESIIGDLLITYYQAWFSIPAFLFLITTFFFPGQKKIK